MSEIINSNLKPIETVYDGYRFRSRVEARWAVFFNKLGVKYEFEKEGFDFGAGGRYLPDFWLPAQKYWVEVKNDDPTEAEQQLAINLSLASQTMVAICAGDPKSRNVYTYHFISSPGCTGHSEGLPYNENGFVIPSKDFFWRLAENDILYLAPFLPTLVVDNLTYKDKEEPKLMAAFNSARQARFEHGESG